MLPAVKMGRGGEERRVRGRERGKEEGYLHVSVGLLNAAGAQRGEGTITEFRKK